ncbi:hypothetical protein [Haloplasma contractile]|uniref:Uncharacterized protein n=1 Tax=Haloplasma contractile SSD-17B TaxID=1033810 RepID=U2FJ33_9MOLU|nr:hypothetical protein [Haloplasma contractile]ERJ11289.1 hypothetical protein HLPCO_002729 [Haloplasma contractile SSD-17B]
MIKVFYTRFDTLNSDGVPFRSTYGYQIIDTEENTLKFNNAFESMSELLDIVNRETLISYLRTTYPDFYSKLIESGIYQFNEDVYSVL